jgi:hypothetical protein
MRLALSPSGDLSEDPTTIFAGIPLGTALPPHDDGPFVDRDEEDDANHAALT